MAMTQVVFADISSLTVAGGSVDGVTGAQYSFPADNRPIYSWGVAKPVLIISVPTLGSGSFTYIAGNGNNNSSLKDWKAALDGTVDVVITGGLTKGNSSVSEGTQVITLKNCVYRDRSAGMNARSEKTVTVSFSYKDETL